MKGYVRSLQLTVLCVVLLWSLTALAEQRQALQTSLSAPVNAALIGRVPATEPLQVAIALPLRNQDQLDLLLQQLYDPASPNYRHFLSVEQFTEQFGPTPVDYQRVIGFAESYGLKITHTYRNRLILDVSGPAANFEQAFQVRIGMYQHPTENRTFYAPDVEPTVEAGMPILGVDGLSSFSLPHSMLKRAQSNAGVDSNQTGSGPGGQFLGSDMRAAYGGGTTLDGTGQVVGLIELGPYRLPDVLSYFGTLGQPLHVPIINVVLSADGICSNTEPAPGPCDDGEEVIDIQQAISMAPNLSALIVYEAYSSSASALNAYNQAASDNLAKSLSISFGWGGTPGSEPGYEQVFEELEAQGQSSFVASGDAGASLSGGYPGNSPNITDAGGTDMTTASAGGAWQSESAWIGSGGGWNTASPGPGYQTGTINSSNGGDSSYRNIPDVSAEANTDNYYCANGSCQGGIGGTSLAAPRWAAAVALINQQAVANATAAGANSTLGFLNPAIYSLSSTGYADSFHDITTGNNATNATCTVGTLGCLPSGVVGFDAVTGFDIVTGWGSPNGPTMFNALAPTSNNPNFSLSASPGTLPLSSAGQGGTSSIAIKALNGFSGTANLTVVIPGAPSSAPAGLSANLSTSTIAAGGSPVTLTVGTTSATPGGTYVIAIVGTSGALTETAYVTVELPAFVGLTATPASGVSLNQGGTASATITTTGINGFSGTVSLSASGVPSGVTSTFAPVNSTTATVTFTGSSSVVLTGASKPASATITGTATGSSPENTGINLFVNPPAGGGAGIAVDLSSAYNVYSFYTDAEESAITASNSLDGVGYALSANLLNSGLDFNGTQFSFGPANQPDAVYGTGTPIALPAGIYTTLELVATGIEGNQASQTVTVTYSDNSTSTFTQSFSDWCSALNGNGCVSTGSNPGESVAVAMPYRDSAAGPDHRVFYLYHYSFALNPNKTVESLTLPDTRDVVVLAATLAGPVTTGFSLAAAPNSVSVPQGGSNSSTVTIATTGGFSGSVALSAAGLPSGVTTQFTSTSTTTSTLTLTATSSATTGPATVTVTGTSGSLSANAILNITVTTPASYSLSAGSPTQGTISPGSSTEAMIHVASANGYNGTVTLACSISPAVTPAPSCSFGSSSPVPVTSAGGAATLTFTTAGPSAALRGPGMLYAALLPIAALALIGVGGRSRDSGKNGLLALLVLSIVLTGLMMIPACGGSGSSAGGGGSSGTPAGTYTITIIGKDAAGAAQSNTAPTVTVTVN